MYVTWSRFKVKSIMRMVSDVRHLVTVQSEINIEDGFRCTSLGHGSK